MKREELEEGLKRLEQGEPVQYIVGNVDFYGNELDVNKHVLIPRFETEELVSKTVSYIQAYFKKDPVIADIGTGSGAIAITLKKIFPESSISAVDISKEALEVAKGNAIKNKVDIAFYEGNLLEPLSTKYDVIISNPPYIDKEEDVMEVVKNNEPLIALYAENQGLACYEKILENASNYVKEKFLIAFEIGYLQGQAVREIARKYFPRAKIWIEKDMSLKDRFVFVLGE